MEFLKHFITEEIYIIPDNRYNSGEAQSGGTVKEPEAEKRELEVKPNFDISIISSGNNDEENKLLDAILEAINIKEKKVERLDKLTNASGKNIIIFGSFPETDKYPAYQVIKSQQKSFVKADPLSVLLVDVNKKKKLWIALQEMFGM